MADDDSRSEDAEKRPGKPSKPSKKPSSEGKKDKAGKKDDGKSAKAKKSDKAAKSDKVDKAEKSDKAVKTEEKSEAKADKTKRRGPVRALITFIREIFEQMRKVVYPTRKQLLTYTAVVLMFVTIMIGIIYGLDAAMNAGVTWVFGGGGK